MDNVFEGYTIIELSSVLAGPYAGMMFSELGAKVIKIENSATNGDVTRGWKHPKENKDTEISAYYSAINYKKEVRFLDLTKMNDINKTYELLKTADVVISNFKKGDDYKFALDYGRVKVINPKIIYAKLSGFENQDNRVAYDVVIQAECGFMSMNGQKDSPPTKMPVALMDVLAGHQLRSGILAALLRREKTKKGALVEVNLERSAISALVNQGSNYLMNNITAERIGSRHPNIALYGEVFKSIEGTEIVLAIGSQSQFENLCSVLNLTELITNEKFTNNQSRLIHLDELTELLKVAFVTYKEHYLKEKLTVLNIPFGEVKNMKQVADSKTGQSMILEEKIEKVATKRYSTVGFSIK
ncbi:MAG TPA: CoA transferase [Flavobacteriales bacterium]|nr:CoA transferase [Flavobacteriales bacterium]|tara:strand:- start:3186 stop:4256 length:1071 start_codon:yes stop_codon:yes gene_type:complete